MKKTIAIILGACIFMAVPMISFGSDHATTDKTELIYDPSELKLSTPVAETLPGVFWYFTFDNDVHGPTFLVSLNAERYDVDQLYAVHNRWYIDISQNVSSHKEVIINPSLKRPISSPINANVRMWCWSACV